MALSERCEVNLSLRNERVALRWLRVVIKEALR
jgi:hypothetical protein